MTAPLATAAPREGARVARRSDGAAGRVVAVGAGADGWVAVRYDRDGAVRDLPPAAFARTHYAADAGAGA